MHRTVQCVSTAGGMCNGVYMRVCACSVFVCTVQYNVLVQLEVNGASAFLQKVPALKHDEEKHS